MTIEQRALLSPAISDETLIRNLRERDGRKLEWLISAAQAFFLIFSISYDAHRPAGNLILFLLAALHLAAIPWIRSSGGLLNFGYKRLGVAAFFGFPLVCMPLIAVALAAPHTYGDKLPQVPLYPYAIGPWLVLTSFPWSKYGYRSFAWSAGFLAFGFYPLYVLALIAVVNGGLSMENVLVFTASQIWPIIALVAGKALIDSAMLTAEAIDEQNEANADQYYERLHHGMKNSVVNLGLAAEELPPSPQKSSIEKIVADLMKRTLELRIAYYLTKPTSVLGKLIEERLDVLEPLLRFERPEPIFDQVEAEVANTVDNALRDLLTNCAEHGAKNVHISYTRNGGFAELTIADDGPGFSANSMEIMIKSLYSLRERLRDVGGDLIDDSPGADAGVALRLVIPLLGG